MVVLLDWNERVFFNKDVVIKKINHSFFRDFGEVYDLKWVVLPDSFWSKRVSFSVVPKCRAFKYDNTLFLKKGVNNTFNLKVNTEFLPDYWRGDLIIKSGGVAERVELVFEKTASNFASTKNF